MPNISGWWTPTEPDVDVYLNDRVYSLTTHWLDLERSPVRCIPPSCILCRNQHPPRSELIIPCRRPDSTIVALLRLPKSLMTDPVITALRAVDRDADGMLLRLRDWFVQPRVEVERNEVQTIPHSRCDRYIAAIGVARYLRLEREQMQLR